MTAATRRFVWSDIALLPELRGHSIGRLLLESLLDEAGRSGRLVRLQVLQSNPAVRLYESLGFRTIGESLPYRQMEWRPEGPSAALTSPGMLENLTRDAFAQSLRTKFLFRRDEATVTELELVELHDLGRSVPGGSSSPDKSFSIVFCEPAGEPPSQGTYTVMHDTLGTFPLLIVPVRRDEDGISYESTSDGKPHLADERSRDFIHRRLAYDGSQLEHRGAKIAEESVSIGTSAHPAV